MFTPCATSNGDTNSKGGVYIIFNSDTPLLSPQFSAQTPPTEPVTHNYTRDEQDQRTPPTYDSWSKKKISIAQKVMLSYVDIAQLPISPRRRAKRRLTPEMLNTVLYAETGAMEYRRLTKNSKYLQLYGLSYGKELGWLAKGIPG